MRAGRRWRAALLAGAAGVAAVGPVLWVTAQPAAAFTTSVNIDDKPKPDPNGDGVFNPTVTTVNVGTKILWNNKTANRHTVTSDAGSAEFDSGQIRPGGSFESRFDTVGTYTYHCTNHPKMVGRVEVVDPRTTTTTTPPTTAPAPATSTTTAPPTTTTAPPTTTTTESRPGFGVPTPPTTAVAAAPPPTTAPSTTTSVPSTTTTTTAPPTTPTSAPPVLAGGEEGAGSPSSSATSVPSTTATTQPAGDKNASAAGPPVSTDGKLDVGAVVLVAALVAVGAFGAWTLVRVRPGRI